MGSPVEKFGLVLGGLLAEGGEEAGPDGFGGLGGVDASEDPLLLVVLNDRDGLGVILLKPLLQGISVVIRALDQGLTGGLKRGKFSKRKKKKKEY